MNISESVARAIRGYVEKNPGCVQADIIGHVSKGEVCMSKDDMVKMIDEFVKAGVLIENQGKYFAGPNAEYVFF